MHDAPVWLTRLTDWLELFEPAFSHRAQRGGLRRYVEGVLSDSRRKSMEAMWARLRDPGSYQALQYFITEAEWSADGLWRRLRAAIPARAGILVLDGTGFPKQGRASVGVQRQYSGTLGKIGNCQVAVTAALWTGVHAWLVGAQLYLPPSWLTPSQRARGRIPTKVLFQEKWRLALTLLRQVRASGITVTAVVADAEFGDCTALRRTLHNMELPYALGVSSHLTVFTGTPRTQSPPTWTRRGMNRLLQGDVGSGKTFVAMAAMLLAIDSGCQAALMAPTQILAEQHYLTFRRWLEPLGVRVALRTGNRDETSHLPLAGEPQMIIGTHALLFDTVAFPGPRAGGDRRAAQVRRRPARR